MNWWVRPDHPQTCCVTWSPFRIAICALLVFGVLSWYQPGQLQTGLLTHLTDCGGFRCFNEGDKPSGYAPFSTVGWPAPTNKEDSVVVRSDQHHADARLCTVIEQCAAGFARLSDIHSSGRTQWTGAEWTEAEGTWKGRHS